MGGTRGAAVEGRSTMGRGSGRGSGPRLTTLVAMHARVLALAGLVASASAFAQERLQVLRAN